jgi:hypothetical protein
LPPPALAGDGTAFSDVIAGRAAAGLADADPVPTSSIDETRLAIASPDMPRFLAALTRVPPKGSVPVTAP